VRKTYLLILTIAVLALPMSAMAIDTQTFNTAMGSNNLLSLYQSAPLEKWQFCISASSNIAGDPVVFDIDGEKHYLINQMVGNQFYAVLGIMGYVDIGVAGSYNYVSGSDLGDPAANNALDSALPLPPKNTFAGTGDVRVMAKARLYPVNDMPDYIGIAVAPFVHIPSGNDEYYMGAGALDAGGLLILDKQLDRVNIVLNVGYKYKGVSEGENGEQITPQDEIPFGLGLNIYAHQYVDVMAEVNGRTLDYNLKGIDGEVPVELMAGARLFPGYGLSFLIGGGVGVTPGMGNPKYRMVLGFEYTYPKTDRTPPNFSGGVTSNPNSKIADSDGDGLSNYEETKQYNTDYVDPDSDGDGFVDGEEVNQPFSDPTTKRHG